MSIDVLTLVVAAVAAATSIWAVVEQKKLAELGRQTQHELARLEATLAGDRAHAEAYARRRLEALESLHRQLNDKFQDPSNHYAANPDVYAIEVRWLVDETRPFLTSEQHAWLVHATLVKPTAFENVSRYIVDVMRKPNTAEIPSQDREGNAEIREIG